MEMVKKNIVSVICGVIALIALIALVWPISGMYDEQATVLKARQRVDSDINNLLKAKRSWPVIPDLQSGESAPLKRFPSEDVIKKGIEIKDQVKKQADMMANEVAQDNRHDILYERSLPNPGDVRFQFRNAYLAMVQDGPNGPSALRAAVGGMMPPTEADVKAERDRIWIATYKTKIVNVAGNEVNYPQELADWRQEAEGVPLKLQIETSHKAKVYIEPNWLSIQKLMIQDTQAPKDPEIWFAQNMLWVQMDIIDAINRLNAGAKNVQEATIKHIFQIDIPDDQNMYVVNPNTANNNTPPPPNEAPAKVYSVSFTGRVSNPLYDVIQFQLVMNVEAAKIPLILTELQKNKLITILQADHLAVDGIAEAEKGFIYGDVPVARLTIRGEELFLRSWTTPLMPPVIKEMLQVPPPPPAK
jgi:hypothetical protein